MAQPASYIPTTDFSDDEAASVGGRATVRTAALDAELAAISTSVEGVRTNLALNQRDDGEIRDGRVKLFTLAQDVLALLLAYGAIPRGDWLTATAYAVKDLVSSGGDTYICVVAHTSGTFATDLAANRWMLFSLGEAPNAENVPFEPTATIAATDVQAAIEESDTECRALAVFTPSGSGPVTRTNQEKLRDFIAPADNSSLAQAIAAAKARGVAVRFDASATVNIPTDAATMQDAVDYCYAGRLGVVITLNIESGHKPATGLLVQDGDFSCFKITSADAVVTLSSSWPANTCVMEGRRATMPTWSILLDCEDKSVGGADGYNLGAIAARENSDFYATTGSGVINNGSTTCANLMIARSSRCTTPGCVFTGAHYRNVWITHTSTGYMELCDFSGADGANVFVSRASVFYGTGSDFSNSGQEGLLVFRSVAMMVPFGVSDNVTFANNGTYAILAQQASRITLRDRSGQRPTISNGVNGIRLEGGSRGDICNVDYTTMTGRAIYLLGASIAQAQGSTFTTVNASNAAFVIDVGPACSCDANGVTFTTCGSLGRANRGWLDLANAVSVGVITGTAITSVDGGRVTAPAANLKNATVHGINADEGEVWARDANFSGAGTHCIRCIGGIVDASRVTATGAGGNGVSATMGATVNVQGGTLTGATTNGIACQTGSRVNASGANAQKAGAPAATDVVIATGGIVSFSTGTGGVSTAINTLTAAGIIFQ